MKLRFLPGQNLGENLPDFLKNFALDQHPLPPQTGPGYELYVPLRGPKLMGQELT